MMMRRLALLIAAVCVGVFALTPTAAPAIVHAKSGNCASLAEYNSVDVGMTRSHIQQDIYGGYEGTATDTGPGGDGFIYQQRRYAHCQDPSAKSELQFRQPVGGGTWVLRAKTCWVCL
jgi:hypothetical protein